jgi:hypothetical protein
MIKRQAKGLRIVPEELRNRPAIELLRMGYDTSDIASSTDRIESEVYNEIAAAKGSVLYRQKPRPVGRPAREIAIERVEIGQSFVIPTRSYHSRGSYIQNLKKKIGDRAHFVVTPEENGVRIIRVK